MRLPTQMAAWRRMAGGLPAAGRRTGSPAAFSLVELLVAVAILGLLVSLLAPSLARAKLLAKVARAKGELAGIGMALCVYHEDHKAFPPARTYCQYGDSYKAADWAELPPELADFGYCPAAPAGGNLSVNAIDPFNPGRTYKYLKPGPGYHNSAKTWLGIWLPDDFPDGDGSSGRDYWTEEDCPVGFALWSVGTYGDIGYWQALQRHHPFATSDWYSPATEKGLIVRACMGSDRFVTSP